MDDSFDKNDENKNGDSNITKNGNRCNKTASPPPSLPPRYDEKILGNCRVIIDNMKNTSPPKKLNRLKYVKLLNERYKGSIVEVKSSGWGKLAVIVNSAKSANAIMNDKLLHDDGLKAFIPAYFISSQGVIKDIPTSFSEDEIKNNLEILGQHHSTSSILS